MKKKPDDNYDGNDIKNLSSYNVEQISLEDIARGLFDILKSRYKPVNGKIEKIDHNLYFAIACNLLNYCDFTIKDVYNIICKVGFIGESKEQLLRELEYFKKKGYKFPTFDSFKQKALENAEINGEKDKKDYILMVKRVWELLNKIKNISEDVKLRTYIHNEVIKLLCSDVKAGEILKHILESGSYITYFKKDGSVYSSIESIVSVYGKKITKETIDEFKEFFKNEVCEIGVRHPDLIMIDIDYLDIKLNKKVLKEIFDKIGTKYGVDIVAHTTGGKGCHIVIYLGRRTLTSEYKKTLKEIILEDIEKIVNDYQGLGNGKIEIIDGEKYSITLWWGRHRKTENLKEVIDYTSIDDWQSTIRFREFLIDYICNKIGHPIESNHYDEDSKNADSIDDSIKELLKSFRKMLFANCSFDMLLMIIEYIKKIEKKDKRDLLKGIVGILNYKDDIFDDEYRLTELNKNILKILRDGGFTRKYCADISVKTLKDFEVKYNIPVQEINKLVNCLYSDNEYSSYLSSIDGIVFDFETIHKQPFAHLPVLGVFYLPKLKRLCILILPNDDVLFDLEDDIVEIYKDTDFEIRVLKAAKPENILSSLFPEYLFIGVALEYLNNGSYLYEVDLEDFILYNMNIDYIEEFLKKNEYVQLKIIAHNIGYDLPILMEILSSFKKKTYEVCELNNEDESNEIIVPLYSGNISCKAELRRLQTGSSDKDLVSGKFYIGKLPFTIDDTVKYANFWITSASLKSLSKMFNKYFKKLDFDVKEVKIDSETITYCIYDVLATLELYVSAIPKELEELKKIKFQVLDKIITPQFDINQLKTSATIPKQYFGNFIKSLNDSRYKNNSFVLNRIFKPFYYGGRQKTTLGRTNNVVYLDFTSQYPHIMNLLEVENIIANLCYNDIHDLIIELKDGKLRDEFIEEIKTAIDKAIEKNDFSYIAQIFSKYPNGILYVRLIKAREMDVIVKVKQSGKEIIISKNTLDKDVSSVRRRDGLINGEFEIDLITFVNWLFESRLIGLDKNKKQLKTWKKIFKEIDVDWSKSFVIKVNKICNLIGDYSVYGIKSKTLPHLCLAKREYYRELMKQYDKDSLEYKKYNSAQMAYKILANSSYGIWADTSWRYYNYLIAGAITGIGRMMQRIAEYLFKLQKIDLIYSDTDGMIINNAFVGDERVEYVRKFFEKVDKLKYEVDDVIPEISIMASKTYRLKLSNGEIVTKTHGRGSFARYFNGKELFGVEFYNKMFDYLEGDEEIKDYSELQIFIDNLRSGKSALQNKIWNLVRYSKKKEESIRNKGYYIENGYLTTHICKGRKFGKFFKRIAVDGCIDGHKIDYIITAFDDEEILKFIELINKSPNNNLKIKTKSVYDAVQSRLRNIREQYGINSKDLGLNEYRRLFRECKLYKLPQFKHTFKEKAKSLEYIRSETALCHTTEWLIKYEIEKITTRLADIRHCSKALVNIYNIDKEFGILGRKVWKTTNEIIFSYKLDDDGNLILTTEDDDAPIRVRVPLVLEEKNESYAGSIRITIDTKDEPMPLIWHKRFVYKVVNKFLDDISIISNRYLVDFGERKPSLNNYYYKIIEGLTVYECFNRIYNAISEKINNRDILLTAVHYTDDYLLPYEDVMFIIDVLRTYQCNIIEKEINEEFVDCNLDILRLKMDITNKGSDTGCFIQTEGLVAKAYAHNSSKLKRLENRYRRHNTKKSLKNVKKFLGKWCNKDSKKIEMEILRVEVTAYGQKRLIDGFELFNQLKEFIDVLVNNLSLLKVIPWGYAVQFLKVILKEHIDKVKLMFRELRKKVTKYKQRAKVTHRDTIRSIFTILPSQKHFNTEYLNSLIEEIEQYGYKVDELISKVIEKFLNSQKMIEYKNIIEKVDDNTTKSYKEKVDSDLIDEKAEEDSTLTKDENERLWRDKWKWHTYGPDGFDCL